MRARLIPLVLLFIISISLFAFSSKLSYPFDFVSHLFNSPRSFLYSMVSAESSPSELDKLKSENAKLLLQLSQMNALKKDNDALRSQFQDTTMPSENLLPARIVGFSGSLDNPTTLVLDQGSKSNVKTGMAVVLKDNLVGKIGKVTQWNAELILPVNKKFSTLAVASTHNSPGIINGEEDFVLLNHVVITDTISKNEVVVTKGEKNVEGVGIPQNLIIGKIMTINKSESQPFQSAVVKSLVNFKKLTTVFVVTR